MFCESLPPRMNLKKLEVKIDAIFDPIVGQDRAKAKLKHWALAAAASDGYMKPLLLIGEPGRGKTRFIQAIIEVLKVATPDKKDNIHLCKRGALMGGSKAFIHDIAIKKIHDQHGALIVDEFHEAPLLTACVLRDMMQPDIKRSKVIFKDGDYEIVVDPKKFVFCLATNKLNKIDPAFKTRVMVIDLEEYSDEQIGEILVRGAHENGLRFHEDSILPLAQTCRGSARDISDIVNDLVGLVAIKGKATVSKDDVRELIKIRSVFPQGLSYTEVRTLVHLAEAGPLQLQQLAARNGLNSKEQKMLEIHPFRRGLLTVESKRQLTAKGHEYLAYLKKHKFI
jgi:Holliday junction DNA helicase RuvB